MIMQLKLMEMFQKQKQLIKFSKKKPFVQFYSTLKPKNLSLPNNFRLISRRAYGFSRSRESFLTQTGPIFDYLGISSML